MIKTLTVKDNEHLLYVDEHFRGLYENYEHLNSNDFILELIFSSNADESSIDDDVTLLTESYIEGELDKVRYIKNRVNEYKALDNSLLEALVEKELGDSTKWEAYETKRAAIKTKYPKPE